MPDLQPREVARELGVWLQNVYCWLWAGRLPAKQSPDTGCWTISRRDLEEFKRQRKIVRRKTLGKKYA